MDCLYCVSLAQVIQNHDKKSRIIRLSRNSICSIGEVPNQFKSITFLDLSYNHLIHLEGISVLRHLRVLWLESNCIERAADIEEIFNLKNLTNLNLLENPICSVALYRETVINNTSKLKSLDNMRITSDERSNSKNTMDLYNYTIATIKENEQKNICYNSFKERLVLHKELILKHKLLSYEEADISKVPWRHLEIDGLDEWAKDVTDDLFTSDQTNWHVVKSKYLDLQTENLNLLLDECKIIAKESFATFCQLSQYGSYDISQEIMNLFEQNDTAELELTEVLDNFRKNYMKKIVFDQLQDHVLKTKRNRFALFKLMERYIHMNSFKRKNIQFKQLLDNFIVKHEHKMKMKVFSNWKLSSSERRVLNFSPKLLSIENSMLLTESLKSLKTYSGSSFHSFGLQTPTSIMNNTKLFDAGIDSPDYDTRIQNYDRIISTRIEGIQLINELNTKMASLEKRFSNK